MGSSICAYSKQSVSAAFNDNPGRNYAETQRCSNSYSHAYPPGVSLHNLVILSIFEHQCLKEGVWGGGGRGGRSCVMGWYCYGRGGGTGIGELV